MSLCNFKYHSLLPSLKLSFFHPTIYGNFSSGFKNDIRVTILHNFKDSRRTYLRYFKNQENLSSENGKAKWMVLMSSLTNS